MKEKIVRVKGEWRFEMLLPALGLIVSLALVGAAFHLSFRHKPVSTIDILSGPKTGAYYRVGIRLLYLLGRDRGLSEQVVLRETDGSEQNEELFGRTEGFNVGILQADAKLSPNIRIITELYNEFLYILTIPSDDRSGQRDFSDVLEVADYGTFFLGSCKSGTRKLAENVISFFSDTPALHFDSNNRSDGSCDDALDRDSAIRAFEEILSGGSGKIKTIFILDTYPSLDVAELVESGAEIISLTKSISSNDQTDALALRYPMYNPVVLPLGAYSGTPAIKTISVSANLVVENRMPDWIVKEITERLFSNRLMLSEPLCILQENRYWNLCQQDGDLNAGESVTNEDIVQDFGELPALRSLREKYAPERHLVSYHEGAEAFYLRDEPSFFIRNAEFLALVISIITLFVSGIFFLLERLSSIKKNRIDEYYKKIQLITLGLSKKDEEALIVMRDNLNKVRQEAFSELIEEKIEANSSFIIFQNFMQGQINAIESRISDLQRRSSR